MPYNNNGPGSLAEPLLLEGNELKCPKCQSNKNIVRNETVLASAEIDVLSDGTYEYSGESKVHWESSDRDPAQAEFTCEDCDIYFEAPSIKMSDIPPEKEGAKKTYIQGTVIEGIRPIDEEECSCETKHPPTSLLGYMTFVGILFHVHFLKVIDENDEQTPVCDPYLRYEDVGALDDIAFNTIKVPGYTGEWVVWLHPGEK